MAELLDNLRSRIGFDSCGPHQAEACAALAAGHDCLLVMPTGVIHEPTAIETVAHNYGLSWKTGRHEV